MVESCFSGSGYKNLGLGYIRPMSEEKTRIYLSASISNAPNNAFLADQFDPAIFEFYLPQLIVPEKLNHEQFPVRVFQQCLEMMTASDFGLVLFDAFGRDCAWECGWYAARCDKPLFGFVESSSIFMRDWMVKGGLDGLVTTNPRMYEVFQANPLLQTKALSLIEKPAELPDALLRLLNDWRSQV